MKKLYIALCLLVVMLVNSSCNYFEKIKKHPDWRTRYKAAVSYYEGKSFSFKPVNLKRESKKKTVDVNIKKPDSYRACLLLEELLPLSKGLKESEDIHYRFASCYYNQGQYLLSAHYYKTFYETFQRSNKAEHALFMSGKSLAEDSPKYNLDQESTRNAITALQAFINQYPQSSYVGAADTLIQDLRYKLEFKAFENARLYYKLGKYSVDRYKAAVIAFNNFEISFPDSDMREEASFLRIRSQYELAKNSFFDKQTSRYEEVLSMHQDFVDKYPKSSFLKQSDLFFVNAQRALVQIKKVSANAKKQQQKLKKAKDTSENGE